MHDTLAATRPPPILRFLDGRWRTVTLLVWLGACVWMLWARWGMIHWFSLPDTDDNMRLDQVRDWLAGQGWYDLRQYRMGPPNGFSIHWSRLVDLPLAALILVAKPFVGQLEAWRFACAVAPLIPMLVAMLAVAVVVRRLVSPYAYPLAQLCMLCGPATVMMWMPMRIDHHGWQLAFLMVTLAGLADPAARRGGIAVALSSALSLAIGLEMLPYIVFAGAILALRWAWDAAEPERLRSYGLAMAAATAAAFLVFASNDNWTTTRCDALTEVWAPTVVVAALLLAVLPALPLRARGWRMLAVVAAGGIVVALFVLAFPQCVGGRLEHVSPEAERLWLSHVREARPIYTHSRDIWLPSIGLPLVAAVTTVYLAWRDWRNAAHAEWLPISLFSLFAFALMFWQMRTTPSAEMLAAPLTTWAAWQICRASDRSRFALVRVVVPTLALVIGSGLYAGLLEAALPSVDKHKPVTPGGKPKPDPTELADRRCPTIPALRAVNAQPSGVVFTFIDAGPRLITLTHHLAVAGPYHRNWQAILDVEHAMRGSEAQARAIMFRTHADYLLTCPHMSEATIYQAEAPQGFYARLARGWTPGWLDPVALPSGSPWRMWRVRPFDQRTANAPVSPSRMN